MTGPEVAIAARRGAWPRALFELLRAGWVEYEHDHARYLAVAMVYYAIVSLIPLLLLLLAALGLLLRFSPVAADAERRMLLAVEASFGPELPATIERLLATVQRESVVATVLGLAGLALAASVLFHHLRLGFRAIWSYEPPLAAGTIRAVVWTTVLEKVIGFVMVLGGGVLLLVALALIAATQWLDRVLSRLPLLGHTSGWLLATATSLILAAVTFALMFKFLPPVVLGWRHVRLAALLCAAAWVVAGELLTLSGAVVGHGPSAYGALGGLLAVMLWMNVVSQMLFFGAELCKVVATRGGEPRR
jgi:membrane protein